MNPSAHSVDFAQIEAVLDASRGVLSPASRLADLIGHGMDRLPYPGSGATLERWRVFALVARDDLSLAKLFESHTDALAIRQELGAGPAPAGASFGVWAAESPTTRITLVPAGPDRVLAHGSKAWCSGASFLSHALLTGWYESGAGPQLVQMSLRQPDVVRSAERWQAVGMAATASIDVHCQGAEATTIGEVGQYLSRPGFWQGGAGIAACWYGGATAIAQRLVGAIHKASSPSPFQMAALGKVDLALSATASLLRATALWIDSHPTRDASEAVLRVRLAAERCAAVVLDEAGRALGPGLFCHDVSLAQLAADLPVFVRQSHAERDFAALAERVVPSQGAAWRL